MIEHAWDEQLASLIPMEVLETLVGRCAALDVEPLLVGAAARDVVLHGIGVVAPRATLDVDLAVAMSSMDELTTFGAAPEFAVVGAHKLKVCGVDVDVVPFGQVEVGREVAFGDGHVLAVSGLSEASADADLLHLPSGASLPVASLSSLCFLKLLAWRDRHHDTQRDGAVAASTLAPGALRAVREVVRDEADLLSRQMRGLESDGQLAAYYRGCTNASRI